MLWMMRHPLVSLAYGFLYLTVLLLWLPRSRKIPDWAIAQLIAILIGLIAHQLDFVGLIPIALLAISAYFMRSSKFSLSVRVLAGVIVLVTGVGLFTHRWPGFHSLALFDHVRIGQHAIPYTLYISFDKIEVGILILGLSSQLISKNQEWLMLFRQIFLKTPAVILVIIFLALSLHFVKFDPKVPGGILLWALTNLLFVSVTEEAIFRGFIQKNISLCLRKYRYGDYAAVLAAALLFGLAHYAGGVKYVLLATVSGIGYGWVYASTKRIEGSILTHFGLNLTHFMLFTYPALLLYK